MAYSELNSNENQICIVSTCFDCNGPANYFNCATYLVDLRWVIFVQCVKWMRCNAVRYVIEHSMNEASHRIFLRHLFSTGFGAAHKFSVSCCYFFFINIY